LVLTTIYNQGEISRVAVARHTGLTRTTVSQIVAEFLAAGICIELGQSPSTGGKRATLLAIAENSRNIVGLDLAASEFRGALINLRGEIIHREQIPIDNRDGEAALAQVYALVQTLINQAQVPIIGIGVGAPGLMEPGAGIVRQAINLNWRSLALKDLLQEKFQLPVHIANDCQVAALGEYMFNPPANTDNLILIKAGVGIGAGIVIGGYLFFGDNAGAGEIGHIQVVENGAQCRCGNYGCLETVLNNQVVIQQAQKFWDERDAVQSGARPETITDLVNAVQSGNLEGDVLIGAGALALGKIAAHLIGAFNINHLRLAGDLSQFGSALVDPVHHRVQQSALRRLALPTQVSISPLGDDIVVLGAASLILKNEFGLF